MVSGDEGSGTMVESREAAMWAGLLRARGAQLLGHGLARSWGHGHVERAPEGQARVGAQWLGAMTPAGVAAGAVLQATWGEVQGLAVATGAAGTGRRGGVWRR